MNPQLLKQRMIDNAILSRFSQTNTTSQVPNSHEHTPQCPCPYASQVQQKLLLRERAFKVMHMRNLYLQRMLYLSNVKQQQQNVKMPNMPHFYNVAAVKSTSFANLPQPIFVSSSQNSEASIAEMTDFNLSETLKIEALKAEASETTKIEVSDTTKGELSDEAELEFSQTPKIEAAKIEAVSNIKFESTQSSQANIQQSQASFSPLTPPSASLNDEKYLYTQLERIINFLLENINKDNQGSIELVRNLYLNQPFLLQVYDKLVIKYFSAKKPKEDIKRYILRKAFKFFRTPLVNTAKFSNRQASLLLCKRYFPKSFEELEKTNLDSYSEDDLLDLFMPYKKRSTNKTMNTKFMKEIFSSEEFVEEYQKFLANFGDLLNEDKERKVEKLATYLMECAKKNQPVKLERVRQLPWLNTWIEDTRNVANVLLVHGTMLNETNAKKVKN